MNVHIEEPKYFGEVCLRKQRRKRQKLLVTKLVFDFAKNTSLHGLKYVTEKGLSIIEKMFWLLTFVTSVAICFLLIRNVWIKWKTSPVIVSFNENFITVGKVPFPSVTICPQIKSKLSVYNYSGELDSYMKSKQQNNATVGKDNSSSYTEQRWEKLEHISLVCDQGDQDVVLLRNFSDSSVIEHIFEVAPDLDDVLFQCSWRNGPLSCEDLFHKVLTREGVCYNLNSLAAEEIFRNNSTQNDYVYLETATPSKNWSVTEGYTMSDPDPYPRRGRENGATPDLVVVLVEPRERDGMCNILNSGFKIFVQHPADMPQSSLYYYAALPKQVSSIALKFDMVTTADSLKDYSPEIRQCYFPWERHLRYFNMYTPNNCRLECQANLTIQKCGCVWFHMPHNDSSTICTAKSLNCVIKTLDDFSSQELEADKGMDTQDCRCLPSCYSVQYDAEILKTEFNFDTYFKSYVKIHNLEGFEKIMEPYQMSMIEMYYKEPRFASMRRSELFGLTDFLANCGGLLGLFLGFSFLSLVEIAYFLTLRLCCTLKRDLRAEKEDFKEK